jgi:hypothetical protein
VSKQLKELRNFVPKVIESAHKKDIAGILFAIKPK